MHTHPRAHGHALALVPTPTYPHPRFPCACCCMSTNAVCRPSASLPFRACLPPFPGWGQCNPVVLLVHFLGITYTSLLDLPERLLVYVLGFYMVQSFPWYVVLPAVAALGLGTTFLDGVVAVVLKWLLWFRARPGQHPFWGQYTLRWWLIRTVLEQNSESLGVLCAGVLCEQGVRGQGQVREMCAKRNA